MESYNWVRAMTKLHAAPTLLGIAVLLLTAGGQCRAQSLVVQRTISTPGIVSCLRYSPDGRWLAAGNYDGTLDVWDAESGAWVTYVPELNGISTLGEMQEEALENTRDMVVAYLQSAEDLRLPIPLSADEIRKT